MTTKISREAQEDSANPGAFTHNLVKLIHPDTSKGLQDLQRQGVLPSSFNQQNGGMGFGLVDVDGTIVESATNYKGAINSDVSIGDAASKTYRSQGFKVGQTTDIASVKLRLKKTLNPTADYEVYIYSDSAGSPNALIPNGTATPISGKLITDNAGGEMTKFTFPTAPNVVAGIQYHIVLKATSIDASNYVNWLGDSNAPYLHGYVNTGDATPTWSPNTGLCLLFDVEPVTTILNNGLTGFDGALHHYEGAPRNQSGGFYFHNEDLSHKLGMIHVVGTGWDKNKTFYDSGLSTDNNRLVFRCLTFSGFAYGALYDSSGNLHEVTSTTDISSIPASGGIVSYGYEANNDSANDFFGIYVNGVFP